MKTRQTGEKRRKEMQRLERQRDKVERRKLRRLERTTGEGEGSDQLAGGEGEATGDGSLQSGSLETLAGSPLLPLLDSTHASAVHPSSVHSSAVGPSAEKLSS